MKKTYLAPEAKCFSFETEEILGISFTGNGGVLGEKNNADEKPATDFGETNIELF